MEKREYVTAAYWYQQALLAPRKKKNGGFYIADSHDFIPAIQMCVCLDKAGRHREAFEFHKKARVADATGTEDAVTQLNTLLANLRAAGILQS